MDEALKQWAKEVAEKEVYRRVVSFDEAKSAYKNKLINDLKEFKVTGETAAFWLEVLNNINHLVEPGALVYSGDLYRMEIDCLNLSFRLQNILLANGIGFVGQLNELTAKDARNIKSFGGKAFNEVQKAMLKFGIMWPKKKNGPIIAPT